MVIQTGNLFLQLSNHLYFLASIFITTSVIFFSFDESDEKNCNNSRPECQPNQFACLTGSKCIGRELFCDGYYDCDDRSDEVYKANLLVNMIQCNLLGIRLFLG